MQMTMIMIATVSNTKIDKDNGIMEQHREALTIQNR